MRHNTEKLKTEMKTKSNGGSIKANKHVPQRTCIGCRKSKDKSELLRIVCGEDGSVTVDESMKAPGRGAYICKDMSCFDKAVKTKAIERALKLTAGKTDTKDLRALIEARIEVNAES